jgi:hypothetical protein
MQPMIRSLVCGFTMIGLASVSLAGELDRETKTAPAAPVAVTAPSGSELDQESPTAAHRRGYYGGGFHHRYYGSGFGGYGGFYRPFVSVNYGAFGGYYPSYSYYSPALYYNTPVVYSGYYSGYSHCW